MPNTRSHRCITPPTTGDMPRRPSLYVCISVFGWFHSCWWGVLFGFWGSRVRWHSAADVRCCAHLRVWLVGCVALVLRLVLSRARNALRLTCAVSVRLCGDRVCGHIASERNKERAKKKERSNLNAEQFARLCGSLPVDNRRAKPKGVSEKLSPVRT